MVHLEFFIKTESDRIVEKPEYKMYVWHLLTVHKAKLKGFFCMFLTC